MLNNLVANKNFTTVLMVCVCVCVCLETKAFQEKALHYPNDTHSSHFALLLSQSMEKKTKLFQRAAQKSPI